VDHSLDPDREYLTRGEYYTVEIGRRWLDYANELAVRVPSILIPEEDNVLLNPRHQDYAGLHWKSEPFEWDQRLLNLLLT
jgi:RES domain-containing protein